MTNFSGLVIALILIIVIIAAIVIGWLVWRHRKIINGNGGNGGNGDNTTFNRAYENLQLVIDQLESLTGDIVTASAVIERSGCTELLLNRYSDRINDLKQSFIDLKTVATVSPEAMSSNGGRNLNKAVNTYTDDMAKARGAFEKSIADDGRTCQGPAFNEVNETYIVARPTVQTLNILSGQITTALA